MTIVLEGFTYKGKYFPSFKIKINLEGVEPDLERVFNAIVKCLEHELEEESE